MTGLQESVDVLKAAGEPTRLRLLALLAHGELTVKDLTDILGQSQPRISRHLKLLADAGLIERYAEGAWAYFRLADRNDGADLVRFVVSQISSTDLQTSRDLSLLQSLRKQQQSTADAYFATVAENWDDLRKIHVPERAVEDAVVKLAGSDNRNFLLDLGTGTGRMLELLADRFEQGVGLDSSREMLAVARAKLHQADKTHMHVRQGDVTNINLAGAKADLITIHQVLHYFDDPQPVIAQAASVLAPEGDILVVDFAPHSLEFLRAKHAHRRLGISEQQMQAWARSAQLEVRDVITLPPQDSQSDDQGLTVCIWRLSNSTSNRKPL